MCSKFIYIYGIVYKFKPKLQSSPDIYHSCVCLRLHLATAHCSDVIMSAGASQIIGVSSVCLSGCSGAEQRKYQRPVSLAFVRVIQRWPVDSPHKGQVPRKIFSFDDIIIPLLLIDMGRSVLTGEATSNRTHCCKVYDIYVKICVALIIGNFLCRYWQISNCMQIYVIC